MKLHLPSMLRKAVLSCMAAVASLSTTVATGVLTGGVVAWAIAAQQAQAGEWIADTTSPEMYDCYKFTGADDATNLDITDGEHVKDGATWIRSYAANLSATVNSITQVADTTLNITGVWNDSTNSFNALTVETLKIGADGTGTGALKIGDSTATEQYITIHAVQGSLSTVTVKDYGNLTLGQADSTSTFTIGTLSLDVGSSFTVAGGTVKLTQESIGVAGNTITLAGGTLELNLDTAQAEQKVLSALVVNNTAATAESPSTSIIKNSAGRETMVRTLSSVSIAANNTLKLQQSTWNTFWQINDLSGAGNLTWNGETSHYTASILRLAGDGSDYTGAVKLDWDRSDTSRQYQAYIEVNSNDAVKGATVELDGIDVNGVASLALNTNNATMQGLKGNAYSHLFAGAAPTKIGSGTDSAHIDAALGSTANNTLTIAGGDEYTFAGTVGTSGETAHLNLAMTGSGTQTFSGVAHVGNVSVSNGTLSLAGTPTVYGDITISGGTLNFTNLTAVGTIGLHVTGGAMNIAGLDIADFSWAESVSSYLTEDGSTESTTGNGYVLDRSTYKLFDSEWNGSISGYTVELKDGATYVTSIAGNLDTVWHVGGEFTVDGAADNLAKDATGYYIEENGVLNLNADQSSTMTRRNIVLGATGTGIICLNSDFQFGANDNSTTTTAFEGTIRMTSGTFTFNEIDNSNTGHNFDLSNVTLELAGGNAHYFGRSGILGKLSVTEDAKLGIFEMKGDGYRFDVTELYVDDNKTLTVNNGILHTGNWNVNMHIDKLTGSGSLNLNAGNLDGRKFYVNTIGTAETSFGNITSNQTLTLGQAGENSILNIGGTITNSGTLILADENVTLNISNIADFKGTIDYDDEALWDVDTQAISTTGNGFALKSGTMHVLSNTGTVQFGEEGEAITDFSTLLATYGGETVHLTTDGKYYATSDEVLGIFVIGGEGDNATVALSSIQAAAESAGLEVEQIQLKENTILEVDENTALSVDLLDFADKSAKVNVGAGVVATASGTGTETYSANYIANMTGTGTLLVNHETLIGQAGSSEGIASDFAGTIQVVTDGFLTLGGSNRGYEVNLAAATIELAGGNVHYSAGSGHLKMVHVKETGKFSVTEVKKADNSIGTLQVDEFRVDAGKEGQITWVNNGSPYWSGQLNVGALTGEGDLLMHHGYWAAREYAISTVGTSAQSFGDITIARSPGGYLAAGTITLNLGADESSVLNFGNFSNQDAIVKIQGELAGQSVISGNGTFNFVGDVTVTGDITMNSTFTQTAGKTLTVDGGSLTIAAATTVDTLSVTNDGVASAHAALTINNLTLSTGSALGVDLSKFAADATPITASTYSDALSLQLGSLTTGEYKLFQGASTLTLEQVTLLDALTGQELTDTGRSTVKASMEAGTGLVKVTVSLQNLNDLEWETADTDNVWASGGGTNWTSTSAGADQQFYNGDEVAFKGEGEEITISGTVQPAYITVSGTGYSFVGDGSIAGNGSILVTEDAALTIATDNSGFTGATTIEEGGTLTITKAKALGTYNNMNHATVLGKLNGTGTFVVNLDNASDILVVKGADGVGSMEGFTGDVVIQRGKLYVGERENEGSGNDTAFNVKKITICDGGELWTHFAYGTLGKKEGIKELAADIDMQSGAVLANKDGQMEYSGDIRFNIVDPSSTIVGYNSTGSVLLTQYWGKDFEYSGWLQGEGTVQFTHPSAESTATYRITGEDNTFAGTYELIDYNGNTNTGKVINLRLASDTAAQYADVKLSSTYGTSNLILDSDATINGLYGVVDADNAVLAQDGNRTLTVSEGDFGGVLKDGSAENVLSLTKQDNGTLVLRGANTYTGDTTIEKGVLELAEGATMGTTAISVGAHGKLQVNAGTYANSISSTGGTVTKVGTGLATLSGIGDDFKGAIDVQGGTLNTGTALEIGNGRALMAGKTGAALSSALTLSDGWLELDFAGTGDALSLSDKALTLAGGSTLKLSNLELDTEQNHTVDLLIGVGRLLGSDGNELDLTGAMASTYFSAITGLDASIDTSTLGLQLADGKLQLVVPEQTKYLVWGEGTGTWAAGQDFSADDQDFTADADVEFGALTGESDTVSISGAIAAGKVRIDAGEGKTYVFSAADDTSGIASAESITVNSGTASFGAGTLDMTAATTISVNDGATLGLANGAIATPANVNIVLNDGSTLQWESGNTGDYSSSMTVANGATVSLVNNGGGTVRLPKNLLNADGETATVCLSGGNFVMNYDSVQGNVVIDDGSTVQLNTNTGTYAQNFSGEGNIKIASGYGIRRLSGTNTYKGETALNGRLIIEGAQALSEYTTFTGTDALCLATAAGEESAEYTINRTFNSGNQTTFVGRIASDFDNEGAVTGVTLNLGSSAVLLGTVYVRTGNAMNVASGASIGGTIGVEVDATLTLETALTNQIQGAGTVKIAGDIAWDNTGKIYTGETQVLAGSTLTAAAPLTSGTTKGKVQLIADEETDAVGTLVITNSANWANKVYGAGTLVLVNTVNNLSSIIDGTATDTLARMEIGKAVATRLTTDVNGRVDINDAAAAAAMAKVDTVVVNAGSVLTNKVAGTEAAPIYLGQNLVLSGAGDADTSSAWLQAALSLHDTTGKKYLASDVTLAADATIYVGNADAVLSGAFDSNGHKLTKTGGTKLELTGSDIDLSGGVDIQNGTLEVNHTATTALAVGAVNLASGKSMILKGESELTGAVTMASSSKLQFEGQSELTGAVTMATDSKLQFKGQSELTGGLGVTGSVQLIVDITGDSTAVSEVDIASAVSGADGATITLNHTAPTSPANGSGVLTLSAANEYAGTWIVGTANWTLQLAHTDAAESATLSYNASAALKLMDGVGTYDVKALKSSVTGASITTESSMRHTLNIINTLTAVADATYQGSVAGTVDVVLNQGAQKFTGTLNDGSSFGVLAGTLAIASPGQSGTHSFTASSGVLDMTGYTRAADATGEDTITALSGRVNGLNLAANMLLTGTSDVAAAMETITLGGSTVLGAGTMKFRVTDSDNTNPGTEDPYKLTNTLYQVGTETGDSISLAGGEAKTLLNLSIVNALTEILDPTEENAGDGYRDHTLIRGITLADANAAASDYFATNLDGENTGSTTYSLHFVQNAGNSSLYDLVLRAMGAADTLFWADAAGGTWEAADQTPDAWVKAQMTDGTLTPTTTTADFEQLDYVVFDDLTDEAGAPVAEVTITVADAGVQIGNMTVQADTTNYIFEGGEIGSVDDNDGATLTKKGTGTLTLKGANSYAGNTTITGGTVIAQNEAALSNTQVQIYDPNNTDSVMDTWLVLNYETDTTKGEDGVFDATIVLDGLSGTYIGGSLRALNDAEVNVKINGTDAAKGLQVAEGKILTLNALAADSEGTNLGGHFYINKDSDGAMTGTLKLKLADGCTYNHTKNTEVYAGEYHIIGNAGARLNDKKLLIAENATVRVQNGMTLQVTELIGLENTYGTISLEDASKLTLTTGGAKTLNTAIESEGATLSATGTDAVMTVTDLTLKGTETNAAADTTLSGGTWVLEQGAVTWDTAATGALVVAGNTTVKVNDDTMKKLMVNASGAKLATAKADGSAAALSVETITVGGGGTVDGVNLTLTGTGSSFGSGGNMTAETADDVVVDLDDSIVMDDSTPEALVINGGVVLDSLTILRGEVRIQGGNCNRKIGGDAIVLNGSEAVLNLNDLNKIINAAGEAPTILIHAGSLKNAGNLAGHVIIDDKGVAQTIAMGGLKAANADVLLRDIETANGVTTLTGLNGVKLADGSAFELTANLAEGAGNLLFDFAEDAPADAAVSAATGATVSIGVSGVLGDVLDAGSVSYTIADKSIAPLASAVAWDATLALFNISAGFGEDGKLTLSATDVPLSEDDIYRSSEDNVGADKTQWAGNGANVYGSSAPYAAVYIDSDTVIDLTQAAAGAGDGLVLSNLIGRGNGANLTITGDGNDKVTINNNLEASDVVANLRALSFNGDMDVTGTTLQVLNTVATPDAPDAGELDTESVYQINGALTTDADSLVEVTAGILKLNGKGSKASELLGGVLVANGKGLLQVSGEASVGGNLDISISDSDDEDVVPDAEIVSGGKLTLLDGAAVMSGFDIQGQGEGKETLIIAKDAKVMLESYSSVTDTVLELQEGSELIWQGTETPYATIVILDGLTGSGAIVNIADQDGQENPYIFINPQGDSTFSGDLSRYDGTIQVEADGEGTQRFDKVTTAADSSKVDMVLNGKSVINVAEGAGNKTLNLSTLALNSASDTTVEMNTDSGAPAFRIHAGSFMTDGAVLTLSSAVGEVLSADDDLLFMEGASENAELAPLDGKSITLDITDNAFRRLNETAKLVVEGNKVYVDLAASETNRYEEGVSEPNAKAGAELLWNIDPSKLPADSALKAIDNAVAELMQNGNRDAAERALAATAGAGTAVLGSAFSADVERQLRAIRNRTTTMGVNQCEVNEGMPYVNAWINAEGDHREMDADGLAAGYTMDSWGGTVGFDVDITNNLTMGMAVTAMYGDLQADSADRAEGDFDTQYVSLFARVAHQAWTHTFVATLGRADVTLNRTVSVPGGSYETSGDTDGMAYGFMYEVARTFLLSEDGTTCWQPVFNVAWRHSSIDAYTESGADNALAVGEQDMNVLTFGAGARLQTVIGESLYNRASIFEARAMVKVDAGDREGEADVALLEGTTAASVKSAEIGAVGVEIGAGVTIPVGLNAGSIFIDGSAEFRSGYSNVNGTVGYRINF